jgi:DNA-binding MarR family transcriptional regulator
MEHADDLLSRLRDHLPVQRGNVSIPNEDVLAALVYVQRTGCRWRDLPVTYGNWHTLYTRVRRWERSGVLGRVVAVLNEQRAPAARSSNPAEPVSPTRASVGEQRLATLADQLRPLIFTLYAHLKQERRQFSLSQFEVTVLMAIEAQPGVGTASLAQRLEVRTTSVSIAVRRMAAQGWVTSKQGVDDDRRRVGLFIKAAGGRVLTEVRVGRSDQLMRQFAQFEREEFEVLERALQPLQRLTAGLSVALPVADVRPSVKRVPEPT